MDELYYWVGKEEVTIQISSDYQEKEYHEVTLDDEEIDEFVLKILTEVDPEIKERILSGLEKIEKGRKETDAKHPKKTVRSESF